MVDSGDNFTGDNFSDDKLNLKGNVAGSEQHLGDIHKSEKVVGVRSGSEGSDLSPNEGTSRNHQEGTSRMHQEGTSRVHQEGTSQTLVTARGTGDGLIVRMNTKKGFEALKVALETFLISRKSFLTGNHVTIEWIGDSLTEDETDEVVTFFKRYEIGVRKPQSSLVNDTLALTSNLEIFDSPDDSTPKFHEQNNGDMIGGGLFGGIDNIRGATGHINTGHRTNDKTGDSIFSVKTSLRENINFNSAQHSYDSSSDTGSYERIGVKNLNHSLNADHAYIKDDLLYKTQNSNVNRKATSSGLGVSMDLLKDWDEADTRSIFTTLRSGQKIETEHSVVILGDINSGAEVIAGGDIFVLGALRGVAHAGAFDETGGGRVIMALDLQPTQLRIGTVISRGVGESTTVKAVSSSYRTSASKVSGGSSKGQEYGCTPEVAYIDGTSIVVEPYNSKSASQRGANTSNR